jgi:pimeloyl-ACP methyl ester carboxylesterase
VTHVPIPAPAWGRRRVAFAGAGALGVLGLSATGAAYAGLDALVRVRPPAAPLVPTVTAVGTMTTVQGTTATVTLAGPGADIPGWAGLVAGRARLLAGPPVPTADGWMRAVSPLPGAPSPLLEAGDELQVAGDPWVETEDPLRLGGHTVTVPTPDGPVRVGTVGPVDARRAVVYVHGRSGRRTSGWWLAPTCLEAGWRTVMPAYRNDPGEGPATGRYLLGGEWVDLTAVLDHLAHDGVEEVTLVGWSMGGNICASYLRARHRDPDRFAHHPRPVGLVLDAAALDWGLVLRQVARQRGVPHHLSTLVMTYGQLARRIDWRDLNHLADPDHLDLPVLAVHGTDDAIVPSTVSEALVARLGGAELALFETAGHCRSVNHEPERYLATLRSFLDRL